MIYDAHGNAVNEFTAICANCGAHIKYVYTFKGKTYGSECIKKVTGQNTDYWIMKNNVIDEKATKEREQKKQEKLLQQKKQEELFKIQQQKNFEKYSIVNKDIINVLEQNTNSDFCKDMAEVLKSCGLNDLTDRQYFIVKDIYCKIFGRFNSKKYKQAEDRFYEISEIE